MTEKQQREEDTAPVPSSPLVSLLQPYQTTPLYRFQISLLPDSPHVTLLSLSVSFAFSSHFFFFCPTSPCMERHSSTVPSPSLRLSFGLIAVSNQHHIGGFCFFSPPESRNLERAKTVQTESFRATLITLRKEIKGFQVVFWGFNSGSAPSDLIEEPD